MAIFLAMTLRDAVSMKRMKVALPEGEAFLMRDARLLSRVGSFLPRRALAFFCSPGDSIHGQVAH
jgi:hypothetical protein